MSFSSDATTENFWNQIGETKLGQNHRAEPERNSEAYKLYLKFSGRQKFRSGDSDRRFLPFFS